MDGELGGRQAEALNTAGGVQDNSAVDLSTPDDTMIVVVACTKEKVPINSNDSIDYDDKDEDDNPIATISRTVHLTSIHNPQIEGKFTKTPGGLTNIFYSCKN